MSLPPRRSNCPLSVTLELVGDKWSLLLLRDMLIVGKSRYREFLASPEGISTNILANRLRQLEGYGLVEKFSDPADGKSRIYLPTSAGETLLPLLLDITLWGYQHFPGTGVPDIARPALEQGDTRELVAQCLARLQNERLALTGA